MTRASAYQEKIDFKTDTRLHWACAAPQNHIARHAECHVSTAFHIANVMVWSGQVTSSLN
jgi:hypothetical protein